MAIIELCREAIDRGELWEAFLALQRALLGGEFSARVREALTLEYEALKARLARRMPQEFRVGFDGFWAIEDRHSASATRSNDSHSGDGGFDPRTTPTRDGGSEDSISGRRTPALEDPVSRLLDASEDDLLPALLEEFRRLLRARSLTVVELRAGDPEILHVSSDRSTRRRVVREISGERVAALRRACATDQLVVAAPYFLVALPGDQPQRVVCIEPAEAMSGDPDWRAQLPKTARLLVACALELHQSRTGLRSQSTALAETRAEIRRLNSLMTRSASELETALMTRRLEMREVQTQLETQGLRSRRPSRTPVGQSDSMKAILNRLPRIAEDKHPVLLLGESGVGKDLIARWIHELGPRRDLPFVAEVCNLSDSLVEAELFGFAKGAFTDAQEDRQGNQQLDIVLPRSEPRRPYQCLAIDFIVVAKDSVLDRCEIAPPGGPGRTELSRGLVITPGEPGMTFDFIDG